MRKRGRESLTAVCSSTGMFTRPNAIEPFQIGRAIWTGDASKPPTPKQDQRGVGNWELTPVVSFLELALGFEPVVEILAVAAAAAEIPEVRLLGDLVGRRLSTSDGCDVDGGGSRVGCGGPSRRGHATTVSASGVRSFLGHGRTHSFKLRIVASAAGRAPATFVSPARATRVSFDVNGGMTPAL